MNEAGDRGAAPRGRSPGCWLSRFLEWPGAVFTFVFLWRAVLLAAFSLPVPSNDSFFYDGPVVNLLLHGKYANPSLAPALPISGTERFCAYPPLYQAVLWGWMSLFGTSVRAAMALHLALFGLYLVLLLAILRRLRTPVWAIHLAGLFLVAITFDDRPDSLAHVWGIAAVYAWIRSRPSLASGGDLAGASLGTGTPCRLGSRRYPPSPRLRRPGSRFGNLRHALDLVRSEGTSEISGSQAGWAWMMAALGILTLATSLQIGAVYGLLLGTGILGARLVGGDRIPWAAMGVLSAVPVALATMVALGFPHVWAGFLEHARQTPSVSGWRLPKPAELLKILRTVPGILAVAALLPFALRSALGLGRGRANAGAPLPTTLPAGIRTRGADLLALDETRRFGLVTVAGIVAPLAITGAALFLLTPNSVMFASQLQPLLVAAFLGLAAALRVDRRPTRWQVWLFVVLASMAAIRGAGLTTWGALCAMEDGCRTSIGRVENVLDHCAPGATVVLSSAYLYQAAQHADLRWIHSDWMAPADRYRTDTDWEGLLKLKPARIILTQFDYYRRYQPLLDQLKAHKEQARVSIVNAATIRAPDSVASLQKVVQHISWAPVVVTIEWK